MITAAPVRPIPEPDIAAVKPFSVSFPDRLTDYTPPASAAQVKEQITTTAKSLNVAVSALDELFLESFPMQYMIRGEFRGAPSAVDQALAAVTEIESSIPDPAASRPTIDVGNGVEVPVSMGWPSGTPNPNAPSD